MGENCAESMFRAKTMSSLFEMHGAAERELRMYSSETNGIHNYLFYHLLLLAVVIRDDYETRYTYISNDMVLETLTLNTS